MLSFCAAPGYWVLTSKSDPAFHMQGVVSPAVSIQHLYNTGLANAHRLAKDQHFDIPDDADVYVHRIGRTGRMGRTGDAITRPAGSVVALGSTSAMMSGTFNVLS